MLPAISFSNLKLVKLGDHIPKQDQTPFVGEDRNWFVAMTIDGKYYVDTQCNLCFATVIEPYEVEEEQSIPDLNRFVRLDVTLVPELPLVSSFATLAILLTPLIDDDRPLIADPDLNRLMHVTIQEITSHLGWSLRWTLLHPPQREETLYAQHDAIAMGVVAKIDYVESLVQQQGHHKDEEE